MATKIFQKRKKFEIKKINLQFYNYPKIPELLHHVKNLLGTGIDIYIYIYIYIYIVV